MIFFDLYTGGSISPWRSDEREGTPMAIRTIICGLILLFVIFGVACSPAAAPTPTPLPAPTASPSPAATEKLMTTGEYLQRTIPTCEGEAVLKERPDFQWPNLEQHIKDLAGSNWGYYSCTEPQKALSTSFRAKLVKPPYNLQETNWIDRSEGTLGVFYDSLAQSWSYFWIVPQAADANQSFVVLAVTSGSSFQGGECRLIPSARC